MKLKIIKFDLVLRQFSNLFSSHVSRKASNMILKRENLQQPKKLLKLLISGIGVCKYPNLSRKIQNDFEPRPTHWFLFLSNKFIRLIDSRLRFYDFGLRFRDFFTLISLLLDAIPRFRAQLSLLLYAISLFLTLISLLLEKIPRFRARLSLLLDAISLFLTYNTGCDSAISDSAFSTTGCNSAISDFDFSTPGCYSAILDSEHKLTVIISKIGVGKNTNSPCSIFKHDSYTLSNSILWASIKWFAITISILVPWPCLEKDKMFLLFKRI